MKKSLLITILILLSAISLEAKRERGVIVTHDQTINAQLIIPYNLFGSRPNYVVMQRGIRYIDEFGKKRRVKPADVKWFEFESNGKVNKMVSMRNKPGSDLILGIKKNYFVLELVDGNVKLYRMLYEEKNFDSDTFESEHQRFILERDGVLKVVNPINFKRDMSAYFGGYRELAQKIEDRDYRYSDLEHIVKEYNKWVIEQ
jgi:hypothetical protein